jgi:hypothetical protein
MLPILQVITLVLVAVGVSLTLAHALELPGKMRLGKEDYVAVQSIYYPGFTIGAFFGEFGAIIAALVLLIATPSDAPGRLLTFVALIALLFMHALYWMLTHAVNKYWVADQKLGKAGAAFFQSNGRTGRRRLDALAQSL